ncbi:sacsin N-terminal ATP-binding-like domain-containing protein [Candidatus Poriferisodalis sp.]|uniref:sacsin N-terminal ATP-binding-like domain-containing protein n=1 Tax=Candidatus Poriferisodalis sp. TaxID=3101277 RepID=UPI003B015726
MQHHSTANTDGIARAIEAAEQVFHSLPGDRGRFYEPADVPEARAAVERLRQLYRDLPGLISTALDAARASGAQLSSEKLQGLAEIIQNADDAGAAEVRFQLRPGDLLASHNGAPICLEDVVGFATPWLSTKTDNVSATGRFGVGLSTLQSLSPTLEVHCGHYRFRIGDPTIEPCELPGLPPLFRGPGWTTLRVPLRLETLQPRELEDWFEAWDASALLFLRNVARVRLLESSGDSIRELSLSRRKDEVSNSDAALASLSRDLVDAADGRSWLVYSTEYPAPAGLSRAQKETGDSTPAAIALPLRGSDTGQIYAGLPVVGTKSPLFANAQFDPLTSRTDFDDNPWNAALVKLVAELWTEAVLDLFERQPTSAWRAIPLPHADVDGTSSKMVNALEAAVLDQARGQVAARLSLAIPGRGRLHVSDLAVESEPLEGVLQATEIARLAQLRAALPNNVRDPAGRWRSVLADWRTHRDDLPDPVSVEQALELLGDDKRPPDPDIALTAVAIREGLDEKLLEVPCVITQDGQRRVPPGHDSALVLVAGAAPLAEQLGLVAQLHQAHVAPTTDATEVLAWLQKCGALLDGSDNTEMLRRLARAGQSGWIVEPSLTDDQVRSLRDAFEHLDANEQEELGPQVGRAILLTSFAHDAEGQRVPSVSRPVDAYLPRAIDRAGDSFAVAAGESPGIVWLSSHYARVLRPPEGQSVAGPQAFLRLLGAETAPRLLPHPRLVDRYAYERQRGLPLHVSGGPEARISAMRKLGATYTLEDRGSPDLLAAVTSIALEQQGEERRTRASALLAALGRAWDRRLQQYAEVDAVHDNRRWWHEGRTSAFWLAQAGDVAWLDDEDGHARRPIDLCIRTPGTEAIYGAESTDFLHPKLDQRIRHAVLEALGVPGDPSRSKLVDRLRDIRRADAQDAIPSDHLRHGAVLVYRALARDIDSEPEEPDLTDDQLRNSFARHGLVLTNHGWQSPRNVLSGADIFKDHRAFAPEPEGCASLWKALRIRAPSPADCLEVLRQIASRRENPPDAIEEAIMLEALRYLAGTHAKVDNALRKKLKKLALWTSKDWARDRPVYATDDPAIATGLGDQLPIWRPGGELKQFRSLLGHLGVTEIQVSNATVIDPGDAWYDASATDLYQRALALMREDLQRNDPRLAKSLAALWGDLVACRVKVHPRLALSIPVAPNRTYECEVDAKVDNGHLAMFVSDPEVLARVHGGGRALAALFEGHERLISLSWRAACDLAEEGTRARELELASERAEQAEATLDSDPRLVQLRNRTARQQDSSRSASGRRAGDHQPVAGVAEGGDHQDQSSPEAVLRTLVEPQSLTIVDRRGRTDSGSPNTATGSGDRASTGASLREPSVGVPGPRDRTPLRGYSELEKESVGLELLRMLLDSDEDQIADLRGQRGVGADAMDEWQNYYELKVSAGSEPNEVTLTAAEYERASTTPDFFLVVVSNLEGNDARPTVRVIVDPLDHLREVKRGTTTLAGLSEAPSLVYEFAPADDE